MNKDEFVELVRHKAAFDPPLDFVKLFDLIDDEPHQYGVVAIAQERKRQIEIEGWTAEHDAHWVGEELACAAAFYAIPERYGDLLAFWPWAPDWNKKDKHGRLRQLQIAGALIAAEIDRLNNAC